MQREIKIKLLPGTIAWLKRQKNKNTVVQIALIEYRRSIFAKKCQNSSVNCHAESVGTEAP